MTVAEYDPAANPAVLTTKVTLPGVLPVAGLTVSQVALSLTEKLAAEPVLVIRLTICEAGVVPATAENATLAEPKDNAGVLLLTVNGAVTVSTPPAVSSTLALRVWFPSVNVAVLNGSAAPVVAVPARS